MKRTLLVCLLLSAVLFSRAQDRSFLAGYTSLYVHPKAGIPWFGVSNGNSDQDAEGFISEYTRQFLVKGSELQLVQTETDEFGYEHWKYVLKHQGYSVQHCVMRLHLLNGRVESFNGNLWPVQLPEFSGPVSEQEALKAALRAVPAKVYNWQDAAAENLLKYLKDDLNATHYPKGELVIAGRYGEDYGDPFAVCWRFDIGAAEPLFQEAVYVNAGNGTLHWRENLLVDADSSGKAKTVYRGYKNITADFVSANSFRLRESKNKCETYKSAIGTDFTDSDNDWNNTTEQAAGDVHWGAEKVYQFAGSMGMNSYDNKGGTLQSIVNLSSGGNAFWNLSGNNATFLAGGSLPCMAIDVVGHEYGHGIADEMGGLLYSGESCMLHESFADINGQNTEWYGDSTRANWAIGEEVWTSSNGIRNLRDPHIFSHPKNYGGKFWSAGGCHNPGEVQNYLYYLIAKGDTGTNDFGLKYSLKGLGRTKANALYYRAMRYYMTPSHKFVDMVKSTLKATRDLYGQCSPEYQHVYACWKVVNLEDTSMKQDLTHGIVAGTKFCASIPFEVQFSSLGDITRKVTWYFGNRDSSKVLSPKYTYTSTGAKRVILVTNVCNKVFRDTHNFVINYLPTADFSYQPVKACQNAGDSIRFTDLSVNPDKNLALDYEWTLDPLQITGTRKNFAFWLGNDAREYQVKLRVSYGKNGCASEKKASFVLHTLPVPSFTVKNSCEGDGLRIVNTTDTLGVPYSFTWQIGSGRANTYHPDALKPAAGKYAVKLTVRDDSTLCSGEKTDSLEIWNLPVPAFESSGNCAGGTLKLVNTTKHNRNVLWFEWDFGIYKPLNKDTFYYKIPKDSLHIHLALQMADDKGCFGRSEKKIQVESLSVNFRADTVCLGSATAFANESVHTANGATASWNFGDGSTSVSSNPLHTFSAPGKHTVILLAADSSCSASVAKDVWVNDRPDVNFSVADVCEYQEAVFQNKTIWTLSEPNWYWQFGDGLISSDSSPVHHYAVSKTSTFNAVLKAVSAGGCADSQTRQITVTEKPQADFSYGYQGDQQFGFTALYPAVKCRWDFGNGTGATGSAVVCRYASLGKYTVRLIVENTGGCLDTIEKSLDLPSGIAGLSQSRVRAYPNPAGHEIVLSSEWPCRWLLISSEGKVLNEMQCTENCAMDISQYAPGVYVLQAETSSGIQRIRIAIQR